MIGSRLPPEVKPVYRPRREQGVTEMVFGVFALTAGLFMFTLDLDILFQMVPAIFTALGGALFIVGLYHYLHAVEVAEMSDYYANGQYCRLSDGWNCTNGDCRHCDFAAAYLHEALPEYHEKMQPAIRRTKAGQQPKPAEKAANPAPAASAADRQPAEAPVQGPSPKNGNDVRQMDYGETAVGGTAERGRM